jgi:circadian clock protein KaiC
MRGENGGLPRLFGRAGKLPTINVRHGSCIRAGRKQSGNLFNLSLTFSIRRMRTKRLSQRREPTPSLPKTPTGIGGLDEITEGGIPKGRPTLICGGTGCGKTLLSMEFLVRGAVEYGEPGVFMAFEETAEELTQNVRSLGFDLDQLIRRKKLAVDFVRVERSEIDETGEYDLEGLFVRLGHAISKIGAKRVVLDTIESLFSGLSDTAILRAELRRLFRWLKDKGVTAIVTGERGEAQLTRQGMEEYVSDCVILLDNRVVDQVTTRHLRIVKYRGTTHGTNEYPFLIDEDGISVLPITSLGLNHEAHNEHVPSGIPRLDTMLGGKGYYRASSVLVTGTAGTGKTSVAAHFARAACERGEKCLYFSFEESPAQLKRNMRSIGVDLEPWERKGLLRFHSMRSTLHGLETHLVKFHHLIREYEPRTLVFDPIDNLLHAGSKQDATSMVIRLIDFLKLQGITALMTNLTSGGLSKEETGMDISSLIDTWLFLRDIETDGERNRVIYILKSRGMAHSNQIREFLISDKGIDLQDVYLGAGGVLTGSARQSQEAREKAARLVRGQELEIKRRAAARRREALEANIAAMRKNFEAEEEEDQQLMQDELIREENQQRDREHLAAKRKADATGREPAPAKMGRRSK